MKSDGQEHAAMHEEQEMIHREPVRWELPAGHAAPSFPLDEISRIMHEAAGNQVNALGIGITDLHEEEKTWMLSRFKAKVLRLPGDGELLEALTWPWSADTLRYYRDYQLTGEDGSPAVLATSQWLMVDLKRRRPVRVRDLTAVLPPVSGKRALEEQLGKLSLERARRVRRRLKIGEVHLDINRHVNNAHYLSWITGPLEREGWRSEHERYAFEIHFNGEARLGEEISVELSEVRPGEPVEAAIRRGEDGSILTLFRIVPAD